ncbi:hypothetical protein AJ80_04390 [Polytolypa hystricis UAMH7299]|uniref:Uncharacterized protein n=1 Tax=Polytolypa hystricis (strain UAMH7299) TaxID=1447883 RepID=A0A2B7YC84_POLH7|nr:hypothetical protein AJ80_04390 [Polytolypa hystricis UAMH7299]
MSLVQIRELLPFPKNGDNATDTLINGIHFNRTALTHFNYTLYSNGTLSNGSNCWLSFDIYKPHMFSNGTFLNATSCYSPIDPLETRGSVGIAFAVMFALTIFTSLMNLRKHGRRFLPAEKRWSPVGRRWQWYWMLFVAACGTISCFMSIDVDRDYLQDLALILQGFFYHLMLPTVLAAVWESVRHWGSWQERQICDRDTFAFEAGSSRERQEFWLPLMFYLFAFLDFFMTIPRSWSAIPKQRSFEQTLAEAKPAATDARFKVGSILAIVCWVITCYSLGHSMYRYRERPRTKLMASLFYLVAAPPKFILVQILSAIRIGFNIASSFNWDISPLRFDGNSGFIYGLGYTPILLILIIFNLFGWLDPNEDRALIEQRKERGRMLDAELGIDADKRKPTWWRRLRPGYVNTAGLSAEQRLRVLTSDIGGGQPTQYSLEQAVEMGHIGRKDLGTYKDQESPKSETNPFSDNNAQGFDASAPVAGSRTTRMHSDAGSQFTISSGETLAAGPPQRIRSMLDI